MGSDGSHVDILGTPASVQMYNNGQTVLAYLTGDQPGRNIRTTGHPSMDIERPTSETPTSTGIPVLAYAKLASKRV